MLVELIYFAAPGNAALEQKLSALTEFTMRRGEDRRSFLTELAQAIGESQVALAVGSVSNLATALSRGLGLPLEPVDWRQFGVDGDADTLLPKGALPLIVDRSVYGMILESGDQCIIAMDSDEAAAEHLYDTYIGPYLQALAPSEEDAAAAAEPDGGEDLPPLAEDRAEEPVSDAADAAEATEKTAPDAEPETEEPDEDAAVPAEEPGEEKPAEAAHSEGINERPSEYDAFADIENTDVDFMFDKPKKGRRIWVAVVCVVLALLLAGGAGWYFLLRDEVGQNYYAELMKSYGDTGDAEQLPEAFKNVYLTRFGALYLENPDVIGTVTLPLSDSMFPVVTATNRDEGFYTHRRFDGHWSLSGTPYITTAYDENNANPNLVIHGGTLFASLSRLLEDSAASQSNRITTDSILYGEDEWEIFSVMQPEGTQQLDYTSNFADLTAEERLAVVQKALSLSKVDFGYTASDFDNVGLSSNFLTLIGDDHGKTVVVMARRVSDASFDLSDYDVQEPIDDTDGEETADGTADESREPTDDTGAAE